MSDSKKSKELPKSPFHQEVGYVTKEGMPDNTTDKTYHRVEPFQDLTNHNFDAIEFDPSVKASYQLDEWQNDHCGPALDRGRKQENSFYKRKFRNFHNDDSMKAHEKKVIEQIYLNEAKRIFVVNFPTKEMIDHVKWLHQGNDWKTKAVSLTKDFLVSRNFPDHLITVRFDAIEVKELARHYFLDKRGEQRDLDQWVEKRKSIKPTMVEMKKDSALFAKHFFGVDYANGEANFFDIETSGFNLKRMAEQVGFVEGKKVRTFKRPKEDGSIDHSDSHIKARRLAEGSYYVNLHQYGGRNVDIKLVSEINHDILKHPSTTTANVNERMITLDDLRRAKDYVDKADRFNFQREIMGELPEWHVDFRECDHRTNFTISHIDGRNRIHLVRKTNGEPRVLHRRRNESEYEFHLRARYLGVLTHKLCVAVENECHEIERRRKEKTLDKESLHSRIERELAFEQKKRPIKRKMESSMGDALRYTIDHKFEVKVPTLPGHVGNILGVDIADFQKREVEETFKKKFSKDLV